MAKVSARGARKVAEARFAHETSETIRALCSDGRILQRTIFRDNGPGRRSYTNGFVHYATLRNPATPESIAAWIESMTARQWVARVL
jgi:hypothetical protein